LHSHAMHSSRSQGIHLSRQVTDAWTAAVEALPNKPPVLGHLTAPHQSQRQVTFTIFVFLHKPTPCGAGAHIVAEPVLVGRPHTQAPARNLKGHLLL